MMTSAMILKGGLLALLILNALLFVTRSEFNDALDSAAWILLMLLYEWETDRMPIRCPRILEGRWIRSLAVAVVVLAELSYFVEGAWLDGIYSFLWILVVILFECESRYRGWVVAHPRVFHLMGYSLAAGMAAVVLLWWRAGAYFNAYDAVLWSAAFLVIDLDLVQKAHEESE